MSIKKHLATFLAFVFALTISAQTAGQIQVTGNVSDSEGEPLAGVTVSVKDQASIAVATDFDGNYKIIVPSKDNELNFSYIGMHSVTEKVGDRTVINVVMTSRATELDDVVVIGYGTQKKVNMTGSIQNIKADDINQIPSTNLSNSLAGRVPGATIVGNSGLMGATSDIRIRGGFGEPLFVIDGVIRDKESFDRLEPNEIDQLSFLKDAASTSIYGSAAGNGVVLVTTKSGSSDEKPVFNYQGSYAFSKPTQQLFADRWTAIDELNYQNAVARFDGRKEPNGEAEYAYFRDNNIDYNVNDYIWQDPWNTKHAMSVTGGSKNIKYFVLGSYLKEEGSYKSLANQKFSLRSNITIDLNKWIKMGVNVDAWQENGKRFYWAYDGPDDQAVYDIYRCTFNAVKTLPFYSYADGTPADHKTEYPIYPEIGSWQGWNPVDQVIGDRYIKTRRRNYNAILNFDIDLSFITKGLSTKITGNYIGYDYTRKRYMTHQKNYKFQQADPNGNRFLPGPLDMDSYNIFNNGYSYEHLIYQTRQTWSDQFNWFVQYNRDFGKNSVSGMVVFEQYKKKGEYITAEAEDPITNIDQMFVYSEDSERRYGDALEYDYGRLSWIGRFNYSYDEKYIAEFSFRYDGNQKFAKGHRWGFFPSASAAWRISQESFMEGTRAWLNNLKLRASYGSTGNDLDVNNVEIGYFDYLQQYVAGGNYIFGNNLATTIAPGSTPNLNLTWATSKTWNFGLDWGFLNNRLTGEFDAFIRTEKNILGSRTIKLPNTYGQSLAPENYAERSWRGGEFSLTWRDRIGSDIKYSVYVNLGYAKDRWDKLDVSATYQEGGALYDLSQVGHSSGRLIGLIADHLLTDPAEVEALKAQGFKQFGRDPYLGGILYKDTRSDGYVAGPDGKIDGNDIYNLLSENGTPRLNYGFGGSFEWKGLSLDFHFQGVGAYDRFVGSVGGGMPQYGGANRPYYPIWATGDCYDPETNPTGKYPRITGTSWYESGTGNTSFWLRNGAYLRLKNLNVGYMLPKTFVNRLGLTQAQVFMNATNLFCISDVTEFLDPEQEYYDSYPLMRTFSFGLNVSF